MRSLPFSVSGWAVLGLAVLAGGAGVASGQSAMVAAGAALGAALVMSLLFQRSRAQVEVRRLLRPALVECGGRCEVELLIANQSRRRLRRGVGQEHGAGSRRVLDLPALSPGEAGTVSYDLTAEQRGLITVGPLVVGRTDPLGLIAARDVQGRVSTLVVHPKVHDIVPFPAGIARDLDGATSGEAPQGGVAFHSLRPYERGDDLRLIHWKSSARTGELMVRHNVDVIQPRPLVYVDTRPESYRAEAHFEIALEAATSILWSCIANGFPCLLRLGSGQPTLACEAGDATAATLLLEALASASTATGAALDVGVRAVAAGAAVQSVAVITGTGVEAVELAALSAQLGRFRGAVLVPAGDGAQLPDLGAWTLVPAQSGIGFADAWNRLIR